MARSAAILVLDGRVALIERQRAGKTYYLFPGGTVEDGETLEETCVREIYEELGLNVKVKNLLAEVIFNENHQYYFVCNIESGVFGTGDGEEYSGHLPPEQGTYRPIWMSIGETANKAVQPKCICELIDKYQDGKFTPRRFQDFGNGVCTPLDSIK